jgi:hypothetical protein
MVRRDLQPLSLLACLALAGSLMACGDDDLAPATLPDAGTGPDAEPDGQDPPDSEVPPIPLDIPEGCNPLAPEHDCFFPWPSDFFLQPDPTLPSGQRVVLEGAARMSNEDDLEVDFLTLHPADGFSHHPIIAAYFEGGVDTAFFNTWLDDPAPSVQADHRTLLLDTVTGELVPHFTETDARREAASRAALYIRPLVRLENSRRYVVALQRLSRATDSLPIPAPSGFAALRDGTPTTAPALEALRDRWETGVFAPLAELGVERSGLVLAWDFTTQSFEHVTRDMVRARELALAGPAVPEVTVRTARGEGLDEPLDEALQPDMARHITGTIRVPLIMDSPGVGASLLRDDAGQVTTSGFSEARFSLWVPQSVYDPENPTPTRVLQFGHGFFGGLGEVDGSQLGPANEGGWILAGIEWWGMTTDDSAVVVDSIVSAPADTFRFVDRVHQAMVNYTTLTRALRTSLRDLPALQVDGTPLIDPDQVYFYGISQGHILGGTWMALADDIPRGVLHVGGASFTLMMSRAAPFSAFLQFIAFKVADQLRVQQFVAMAATSMDRIDPITWTPVLREAIETTDRRILMQVAVGDGTVPNVGSYLHARALGLPVIAPAVEVPVLLDSVTVPAEGSDISALQVVGYGVETRRDLRALIAPGADCIHNHLRRQGFALDQISAFLAPGGRIVEVCEGACETRCD